MAAPLWLQGAFQFIQDRREVYVVDQENQTVNGPLLEQIERQSEIIAYLLGKNERLRSQLMDLEQNGRARSAQEDIPQLTGRRGRCDRDQCVR
jgi:hypothetical protein